MKTINTSEAMLAARIQNSLSRTKWFAIGIGLLLLLGILGCEKTVELDLNQAPSIVVIEGLLTDEYRQQSIRLRQSVPFYDTNGYPAIESAVVSVQDEAGNTFTYSHTGDGHYLSDQPFAGQDGETYNLLVEIAGQSYTASESLRSLPEFDSLTVQVAEEWEGKDITDETEYEVLVYIREPQETEDFYLIKFYRNDTIQNDDAETIFYAEDNVLGEDINALPFPYEYQWGDTARIEMYQLSREAFRFYTDLDENINSDGGMFDPVPSNIRTNIEGGAIGYFQVSGLTAAEIVLE